VREYLSFMPSKYGDPVPARPTGDPADRRCEELYDIVPASNRQAYDMRRVLKVVADDGEFFPMKPDWAKSVITGFARFGGRTAGVVASQPMQMGGALDMHSADKAARFVNLCDSFEIPLVFLVDVPGFLVGKKVEHDGIIRHGAKMLYNVSEATVPKVTVVLRKAYGAGYFVMAGRAYESDHLVAWPTAEIAVMGPEGAVNIVFRREIERAEDPEARRAQLIAEYQAKFATPYAAAERGFIDDVIEPALTRSRLVRALRMLETKREAVPARKHGNIPL
jgi:acetyl-CoA carboxylase carboxyltransferase component